MIVHITMDSKNFEGQYFNAAHVEASSTNNDHYTQGVSTKWKYDNLRGVLERLKKKDSFPERILVPSQYSNIL